MKRCARVPTVLPLLALLLAVALLAVSCDANPAPKSPAGTFAHGSTTIAIGRDGGFTLEHEASSEDPRTYAVTGTCTWTLTRRDADNETSVGRFDLKVTALSEDGRTVSALDFTDIHEGADVAVGDTMPGWWKYLGLATWPGKLQLKLNLPSKGLPPEDENSGSQVLWLADPVK